MHDLITLTRCPRCLAPTVSYVWHPGPPTGPVMTRRECVACDHVRETTEDGETAPAR